MDQSKKTMRHFYCRDVLWETFEQMANDFDCSIDYLVNEAMRYYARSKNYQSSSMSSQQLPPHLIRDAMLPGQSGPIPRRTPMVTRPVPQPPQIPQVPPAPSISGDLTPAEGAAFLTASQPSTRPGVTATPMPAAASGPVTRRTNPPDNSSSAESPTLFLMFNNQRIAIEKDQFIIGRGSKTSDLPIKDGNISRKHAAIIRRNGVYYIKDLGSTNGIDYKGMRIDNKRIDEGDVFHLCDYELRFTYRS
jgi:hypothetical protein